MSYFSKVDLPHYPDLYASLASIIEQHGIDWKPHNQICMNTMPGHLDDCKIGAGSLVMNWENHAITMQDGIQSLVVERKAAIAQESDFTVLCTQFKGTIFEEIYQLLDQRYQLGRVRFMRSEPKTCLSWHEDTSKRLHYPLITHDGCFMVINDEVMHIPNGQWTMADTVYPHTAFNASKQTRIHLVAVILGEK